MTRITKSVTKQKLYSIKLPEGTITVGPGTVPTSETSVKKTIISEMVSQLRKASKEGIFNSETNIYGTASSSTTK